MPRQSQARIDEQMARYREGMALYAHKEFVVIEDSCDYAPHPEEKRSLRRGDVIIPRTVFCERGMRTLWLLYQMERGRESQYDGYLGRRGWGGIWEQHVCTPEEYERRMRVPENTGYDFISPAIFNSTLPGGPPESQYITLDVPQINGPPLSQAVRTTTAQGDQVHVSLTITYGS